MRMYRRLLLREFLPFLILGVLFFGMILILADLFSNMWRYLNSGVSFAQTFKVSLLYGPKALSYALPIGAMFAAAFALGNLGARNELIAVFGSGVSLLRFVLPILVISGLLSVGGYLWDDRVVIPLMKHRNMLSDQLLEIEESLDRSQVAVVSRKGEVVYYADHYNNEKKSLRDLTVVRLDDEGRFSMRLDVERARWDDGLWVMEGVRAFTVDEEGEIVQNSYNEHREEWLDEPPSTFTLDTRDLTEMNGREARLWIASKKRAGLPYRAIQAEFYQRFTMAFTPLLVVFFAGVLGGRFRKNILLMSLLGSLGLSSAWYIIRMIATLLSEVGTVSPLMGAAVPYVGFLVLGYWLFRYTGV